MEVKINSVNVANHTVDPNLILDLIITHYDNQVPISVGGHILSGSKTIAILKEYDLDERRFTLQQINHITPEPENRMRVYLIAALSPAAIAQILNEQEKNEHKSVQLTFSLGIRYLGLAPKSTLLEVQYQTKQIKRFDISQSDWINHYATGLGIGNFLLVELRIPEAEQVPEHWIELYSRLRERLENMQIALKRGDWEKTLVEGRKYYENIKFNKTGKAHKHREFKDELKTLFLNDRHSEAGFNNFHDGIINFFGFLSKYGHDQDTDGSIHPIPIPSKEDAYFAFTLAAGLLNIISRKLNHAAVQ